MNHKQNPKGIRVLNGFNKSALALILSLSYLPSAMAEGNLDEMDLIDLMNMEMVSSGKMKQDLSEVTSAAYVISADDIKHSGATDLPTILKMVPGLFIAEAGSNSWAMGIRGFNSVFSNKMLVMIDGRSLFSPVFSGVFWEQLDLFIPDIERIEVIRGVGSTVWGANAVNGIINIITKSTLDNESSQLYASAGNHNRYDVGFRFGTKVSEQSYARAYVKSKDIKSNEYEFPLAPVEDDWDSNAAGFKWELYNGPDSVFFSGDYITQTAKDTSLVTTRSNMTAIPLDNRNVNLSVQWQRQMSIDKAFTFSSQIQRNRREGDLYRIDDKMSNVDFDTNYKWDDHQLLVGVGFRRHDIEFNVFPSFLSVNNVPIHKNNSKIFSAYIQDEWSIAQDHNIMLGTKFESHRHDDPDSENDYDESIWLPTLRYRFDVSEDSRLWMAISRSARVPSMVERGIKIPIFYFPAMSEFNPSPYDIETFSTGNAEFSKEKLLSYELGFRANIDDSNSIDATIYYNKYDDVRSFRFNAPVCTSPQPDLPFCPPESTLTVDNTFENDGEIDIKGVELSWMSRVSDAITTTAHYIYTSQYSRELVYPQQYEDSVLTTPRHQFTLQVDWQYSDVTHIRLLHKFVSGIDEDQMATLPMRPNFLHHYHSLDFIATYQWSADKRITLSVENLFQSDGERWSPEFPNAQASFVDERVNLGVDIKF